MVAQDVLDQKTIAYILTNAHRPYAKQVEIKDTETQETVYKAEWQTYGTTLILNNTVNEILQLDFDYTINILFSETISECV